MLSKDSISECGFLFSGLLFILPISSACSASSRTDSLILLFRPEELWISCAGNWVRKLWSPTWACLCLSVCVWVCVREREREGERELYDLKWRAIYILRTVDGSWSVQRRFISFPGKFLFRMSQVRSNNYDIPVWPYWMNIWGIPLPQRSLEVHWRFRCTMLILKITLPVIHPFHLRTVFRIINIKKWTRLWFPFSKPW